MTRGPTQRMVIRVPGDPVAWSRAGRRTFRNKTGQVVTQSFTPSKVLAWEEKVAHFATKAKAADGWIKVPPRIPVSVSTDFHYRRPSGFRKGERFKFTTPDRDNLDKAVLDALQWADVFTNDGQVVDGRIRKLIDDDWQGAIITVASGDYVENGQGVGDGAFDATRSTGADLGNTEEPRLAL